MNTIAYYTYGLTVTCGFWTRDGLPDMNLIRLEYDLLGTSDTK